MEDNLSSGTSNMPQICVCSLHELNKSACVGEGPGRTKAFPNFLCI
jgi:hypothetical protein